MKRILAVVLALLLMMSMGSVVALAEGTEFYGGYTDTIKSSAVVYQRANQGDADNIWWWDFCRAYFGIDFEVTQVTSASDYKSVAFASGDMPDVFYQLFIGSAAAVEQGEVNGNLIALNDYITPEIMPNLSRIYEAYPAYKALISTRDGNIYSLGSFNDASSPLMTFFINQRWLDEANLDLPTTIEEFTEVMVAFKARGEKVVPLTGDLGSLPRFLANSFGWITDSAAYLTQIALKDDVPMHIYSDEERFPLFMQLMKEYIAAGYFSADVFDDQYAGNQSAAHMAEDLTGFSQTTSGAIDPFEWTAAIPLVSEFNPTPQIARSYNAVNCQSFSISATCDPAKIERLMKWADWHYDFDNYTMSHNGPSAEETEWLLGLESGYTYTVNEENGRYVFSAAEVDNGTYPSFGEYQNQRVQGIIGGYVGLSYDMFGEATRPFNPPVYDNKQEVNVLPYLVDTYPNIIFFETSVNSRVSELATDINAFVTQSYVDFISGEQDMTEEALANYFTTLKSLGYEEYVGYYVDYYNSYKASIQ